MTNAASEILTGISEAIEMQRGTEKKRRSHKILNAEINVKEIRRTTELSQSEFTDT